MLNYDRKSVKSWAKSRIPYFWERRFAIGIAVLLLLFLFFFRDLLGMAAVMLFFIVLGVASMMYNRWLKVSLGVELIMFGMVISTILYGRVAGLVVGFVALFFAEVVTNRFTYSTFISFVAVFVVVMMVPLVEGVGVTWTGIWMTLLYDAVIGPGYILMGSSLWRTLLFVATHIMFNAWVFAVIAPRVTAVL